MTISVLIVDDDEAIREATRDFLDMMGYRVAAADSAEQALIMMDSFCPEIVLTDIMLHGMDGLELTRNIKKHHEADIIVMTGYSADYSYENAVTAGASDFIFKPFRFEELNLRIKRVVREMQLKLEHAKLVKKLEELAITDALTKLYNSRFFFQQLKSEIERHVRYNRSLSLLILDLDNFKEFNDSYGHLEGDKVLMKVGQVIASCLRTNDTAYRYGGDEFMIILPETEIKRACLVAERIREALATETFSPLPGKELAITMSIGVTEYSGEEDIKAFVKKADMAMYKSKEEGRNKITCVFND